jgi:Cytochrome c554 and c-prime
VLRFNWSCFALVAFCAAASAKEIKESREGAAKFVGSVGCRSSSCHGGAGEKRSQYITWSQKDFHAKAFAILLDARSARIADAAGIAQAQSSARCTVCHSPFQSVAQTRLAPTTYPDEGVSCESCHGAAEPWLRGHTRTDWTYPMRVTAGMRDLKNFYVRANTCVACHQNIDNDLLRAGHPALVFELDSQSVNEPKHWRNDDSWSAVRAWLTGQAVALREAAWRSRTDRDPAVDMRETSAALAWLLAKATLPDPMLPKISEPQSSDLEPLQIQADDLARRAATWHPAVDSTMAILRALAASDAEFVATKRISAETLFYRAKRLCLALDRLTNALKENGATRISGDKKLNSLREDVRLRENFDAPRFAGHLRAFRAALTK